MDNPQNTSVKPNDDLTNTPQVAYTPEGLPVPIETPNTESIETIGMEEKKEVSPEVSKPVETLSVNNTPNTITTLSNTPVKETKPVNVVNKTTHEYPNHKLDTTDQLSQLADDDEKDFIENVRAAHDNN